MKFATNFLACIGAAVVLSTLLIVTTRTITYTDGDEKTVLDVRRGVFFQKQ
jgi:hypothetical protein